MDQIKSDLEESAPAEDAIEDLTAEEANRIIHSHRKVRYGKSRFPGAHSLEDGSDRGCSTPLALVSCIADGVNS